MIYVTHFNISVATVEHSQTALALCSLLRTDHWQAVAVCYDFVCFRVCMRTRYPVICNCDITASICTPVRSRINLSHFVCEFMIPVWVLLMLLITRYIKLENNSHCRIKAQEKTSPLTFKSRVLFKPSCILPLPTQTPESIGSTVLSRPQGLLPRPTRS